MGTKLPAGMRSFLQSEFVREYGMVFVLLLLCVYFSARTIKPQHPTGEGAGRQVAADILRQHDAPNVIIVAGTTDADQAFAESLKQAVETAGGTVLATVNGQPRDAVQAIDAALAAGKTVEAIGQTDVTSKWGLFNTRYPQFPEQTYFKPNPYLWPNFLKVSNLLSVADQTAIYAIIGIGMTMVIVTAGIDLSIGSLIALASVTAAVFIRDYGGGKEATVLMMIAGCALGIGICALSGAFVGTVVTAFRVPPFIVTLAMMMIASGLAFSLSEGKPIDAVPASIKWLGGSRTLGVHNTVWLTVALYGVASVVMSRTVFGRHIYAIGGNEEAAKLSGIRIGRVLIIVYAICGGLAGLGGILLTSRHTGSNPTFGALAELEVIAAVVVGGTSLMGGRGRIFGTLIGAFIIAVIKNGMNMTGVEPFSQKIVLGAVLLGAVLLDTLKRRGLKV